MLFYRLVICRLMTFLGLDELYKEREQRAIMIGKKMKPFHKPKLLMDENMQVFTFMILAFLNMLFIMTLPLVILKEPSEGFKDMPKFYEFAVAVKNYATLIDTIMILMFIALIISALKIVLDAIAITKINLSPWLEQGKYTLPGTKCCDHDAKDPAKERAEARARARYYDKITEEIFKQYEESNGRFYDREFYEMYYGRCHRNYDRIFNETYGLNCNRTSRQTLNQTSDQTKDKTYNQTIDQNNDQTFDIADDKTYDHTFALDQANEQNYGRSYYKKLDQDYQEFLDQTYVLTPEQSSEESSDQSSDISSGGISDTDTENDW